MPDERQKVSFVDNLHAFVKTQAHNNTHILPKGVPVHVSAIKQGKGQVDLVELTIDATGPYTLPKIIAPQAHSKYHREPTQVGDKGYYVPGTYYIGGESGQGGGTASMYPRGNLTTGVFHPISNTGWDEKDPNMFLVTGGPSGHTIQSADKKTSMVLDIANNLIHTSSANIIHQAQQQIAHIANGVLTHASLGGTINLVQQQLHIGAPSTATAASSSDLPNIPTPGGHTLVNIIGDLFASGTISTPNGSIGPGGSAGPPGPQGPQGQPGAPIQGTVPQPVTGAKGGNAALTSLIAALVAMGLILDYTTP